jgi:ferrous iron transport protein B
LVLNKSDLIDYEIDASALSVLTNMPVFHTSVKDPSSIHSLASLMSSYCDEHPSIETSIKNCIGNSKEDYAWAESCANTVIIKNKNSSPSFDYDRLLLHPVFAPFIFFGIMLFFFWSIFSLSSPFMDMIDSGFSAIMSGLSGLFPSHVLSELLIDGCIGGIGAFMVFSPQIFILFCVLGMMESSGYLARGAIIMDRPLSMIGLSGRSFVPLLSGCACAIPAMMATRSIPSRKERLVAIFIIPLMSCSARLPVYGLLFALLFSNSSSLYAGLALTSVYAASVCLASIIGAIASRIIGLKKEFSHFDIELPRLHVPSFKNICIDAFHNTFSFIRNAGPIILVISLILWFLGRFPSSETSFIILLSQWIEPVLRPMGVDGRVGIAILLSFAAREVFVSSLALVFSTQDESSSSFLETLSQATISGQPLFTTASIVSLVVFFIISMQCMATLAIAKKETGSWRIPGLMMVAYTLLAYFCSVFVYSIMSI